MAKPKTRGQLIGEALATRLKERGVSVYSAAKQAGITFAAARKLIDGGVDDPLYTTVEKLALVAGIDLAELLGLPPVELKPPARGRPGRPKSDA